jgi:hypothetical protein
MAAPNGDSRPPMAVAMEWVSQITTVVAEMVLPGLAGQWLDKRWGTQFLALIGFGLGVSVGIWHLVAMTRPRTAGQQTKSAQSGDESKLKSEAGAAQGYVSSADTIEKPQPSIPPDPPRESGNETD